MSETVLVLVCLQPEWPDKQSIIEAIHLPEDAADETEERGFWKREYNLMHYSTCQKVFFQFILCNFGRVRGTFVLEQPAEPDAAESREEDKREELAEAGRWF